MCMPWGQLHMGRMHGLGWWCPCHRFGVSIEEEIKTLEAYKKMLEEEIEVVNKRIKELRR